MGYIPIEKKAAMNPTDPQGPTLEKAPEASNSNGDKYFVVVDDNQGDQLLLKKALEDNGVEEPFRFVGNGLDLIHLLEECKPSLLTPAGILPCLILLDLYMPRVDGHEALRIIKNDRDLRKIPIIILTSSHTEHDITQSYHEGANSFLSKPMEYRNLVGLIGLVKKYWLEEARLPV